MNQSRIFPMFFRAEYDRGQAFTRFQSDAQRAANQVKQEFTAVGRVIDEALAVERNSFGSLDLGLDELRESVAIQQQRAIASREVAEAATRAAQADGAFNAEMAAGVTAARQYATEQDRISRELQEQLVVQEAVQRELNQTASATDRIVNAQRRGTTARGNVINSVRAERVAFVQLGQQLQDVTVQAQLGTNAFQIFAQQAPQAAFALTGLSDSANTTKARIGALATFLSGPWGAAVFAATAVLGPYILSLFESAEAADDSTAAHETLAEQLDITRNSYEAVLKAAEDYNAESRRSIQTTLQVAQAASVAANARLDEARATRQAIQAQIQEQIDIEINPDDTPTGRSSAARNRAEELTRLRIAQAENEAALATLETTASNANFDLAVEQARIQGDTAAAIAESYAFLRQQLRGRTNDVDELREGLIKLNAEEQKALDAFRESQREQRSSGGGDRNGDARLRRLENERRRLEEFGADAADRIGNIRDQFSNIPSEVQRVNRLVRTLNDLIEDLNERQPTGFKELVEDAIDLRDALPDLALNQAVQQITEEYQRQSEIQRLTLAGRFEEVEVQRIMTDLEERFGEEAQDRLGTIEDIVEARERERQVLERLREEQDSYLSATQSVRQEIESLLAGESVDFERIFRRLRARILTEQLFGDVFRQLDRQIRGSYEEAVEGLSRETVRASSAIETFTDAALAQARRMQQQGAGGPNTPPSLGAEFDRVFGLRNAAGAANDNRIIVEGTRKGVEDSNTALALTPEEYADMLAKGLVQPLLDRLPAGIAQALDPVLSGALSGFLQAGPVGGILGGLNGLFGEGGTFENALGKEISAFLGGAVQGAGTGAQVDAIFDALGIKSSGTGAVIGGALGSILGPIGSLAGSVLGGLFGGLLSGTPRGSATIGGFGSNLSVTGTRGNSSQREQAGRDLAEEAIGVINRFADEIGASVNASAGAVSIGIRNDSIRVDPTGRGVTKTSNGAIDFGEDAEAAVLFAVQNLINDGVIEGLRRSERNLLNAAGDIEQALADILAFRDVFDRLNRIENPVEQQIRELNREFEGLIDLFERAQASAAEFADLERLYDLERARLVEEATERVAGSLQDLIRDLTIGDSGLSLRSRRANALTEFNDLRARVEAGDSTAFDDFEQSARDLLDIERQIFGSQQQYFDRLNEILAISNSALAEQQAAIEQASGIGSPFGPANDNGLDPIGIPIAQQTDILGGKLDAVNFNLGTISQQLAVNGGGINGSLIANVRLF